MRVGNSLPGRPRMDKRASWGCFLRRFQGIELRAAENPPFAAADDYPSARD